MTTASLFQPVASKQTPQQVADQIRELIRQGKLQPGARLPSERQLAAQFSVGRSSLREAVKSLSSLGYLDVKHGRGTFVAATAHEAEESWLPWLAAHRKDVLALLEVREALEVKAAALAARHRRDADLRRLAEANRRMAEALAAGALGDLEAHDIAFHRHLAEASRNPFLVKLNSSINHAMADRRAVFQIPGRARASIEEHERVAAAVARRDAEAATAAMAEHMSNVKVAVRRARARGAEREAGGRDGGRHRRDVVGSDAGPKAGARPGAHRRDG